MDTVILVWLTLMSPLTLAANGLILREFLSARRYLSRRADMDSQTQCAAHSRHA